MKPAAAFLPLFLIVAAGSALAQGGSAVDTAIGAEVFRNLAAHIASATESAGRVSNNMAAANQEIVEARRRFWAEYDAGIRNGPAEAEFARRLLGKDLALLGFSVSGGTQGTTLQALNAIFGELDGGVRPAARSSFDEWIEAIRAVLGATRSDTTIFATPTQLLSAIEKTGAWYDVYRQWRDWAEFSAHGLSLPQPTAAAPGENALGALLPRTSTANDWLLGKQQKVSYPTGAAARHYDLLQCTYVRDSRAPERAQNRSPVYHYWYGRPAMSRAQILRDLAKVPGNQREENAQRDLRRLIGDPYNLSDAAFEECPPNEAAARSYYTDRSEPAMDTTWYVRWSVASDVIWVDEMRFSINGRGLGVNTQSTPLGQSYTRGEFDGRVGRFILTSDSGSQIALEVSIGSDGLLHGTSTGLFAATFVGYQSQSAAQQAVLKRPASAVPGRTIDGTWLMRADITGWRSLDVLSLRTDGTRLSASTFNVKCTGGGEFDGTRGYYELSCPWGGTERFDFTINSEGVILARTTQLGSPVTVRGDRLSTVASSPASPPGTRRESPSVARGNASPVSGESLAGRWTIRREGLLSLLGSDYLQFEVNGAQLTMSNQQCRGTGRFDGRAGTYTWTCSNRQRGRTDFTVDDNGVLHGTVRPVGDAAWTFRGERK